MVYWYISRHAFFCTYCAMLKCLAVCLLCFYFVTYCAQIMHKIIIIERHTTILMVYVCYNEASNLD